MRNGRNITTGGRAARWIGVAAIVVFALALLAACSDERDVQGDRQPSPSPNATSNPVVRAEPTARAVAAPMSTPRLESPTPTETPRPTAIPPKSPTPTLTSTPESPAPTATPQPTATLPKPETPTPATEQPAPTATPRPTAVIPKSPTPVPAAIRATSTALPSAPSASDGDGLPGRDLADLAVRFRGVTPDDSTPAPATPLEAGERLQFWITDTDDGSYHAIDATLRVVSDNAYWFVDDAATLDQAAIENAASRYEAEVHPAVVGAFGNIRMPGLDGDPRLFILNAILDGPGGYFGAKDAYSPAVHESSNAREIIYVDTRVLSDYGEATYLSVIAHELQHAVHFNFDEGEESWVNEGLSELASSVAGYPPNSPAAFLRRPGIQLNHWPHERDRRYAHYGASALFFTYLAQRVGGPSNLADLVTEPLDGIAGVERFLIRYGLTFEDVFADWTIANYLDADSDKYGYRDREVRVGQMRGLKPYSGRPQTAPQFSARYYEFDTAEGASIAAVSTEPMKIDFRGDATVRQVGADCELGPRCWWSGAGDSVDTTMTREFDLTGMDLATLEYSVWYEIEEGWDYAYVEISDDGGETWHILDGRYTTDDNPSGNAYGPGYTGESGGWLRESIDLTPFAGGPVLIRFEYVTDDAVHRDGLLIERVGIREMAHVALVGWDYDLWKMDGFSLIGERLEQTFIVQVIEIAPDGDFTVSRIPLDRRNYGDLRLSAVEPGGRVIVVVSPTTPGTMHPAGYVLRVD